MIAVSFARAVAGSQTVAGSSCWKHLEVMMATHIIFPAD